MPKLKHCSSATQVHRNTRRLQSYRERQNNAVQLSEFTATMPLESSTPVANMSSTTQQHTPCLDSEFTTTLLGTSDMSAGNSLQPQQHAAGVGTAGSDSSVLSTSDTSNIQHSQKHASGGFSSAPL